MTNDLKGHSRSKAYCEPCNSAYKSYACMIEPPQTTKNDTKDIDSLAKNILTIGLHRYGGYKADDERAEEESIKMIQSYCTQQILKELESLKPIVHPHDGNDAIAEIIDERIAHYKGNSNE